MYKGLKAVLDNTIYLLYASGSYFSQKFNYDSFYTLFSFCSLISPRNWEIFITKFIPEGDICFCIKDELAAFFELKKPTKSTYREESGTAKQGP